MEQTYILLKPGTSYGARPSNAFFHLGEFCHAGNVTEDIKFPINLKKLLPVLEKQQSRLPFYCRTEDLPRDSEWSPIVRGMKRAANFMLDEITDAEEELLKLQKCDMVEELENDLSNAHFQLNCRDPLKGFADVELVLFKMFAGGGSVQVNVIYQDGQFHANLVDGQGEHLLVNTQFPKLVKHGSGYPLRKYDKDDDFSKLVVFGDFQSASLDVGPRAAAAGAAARNSSPSPSKKKKKKKSKERSRKESKMARAESERSELAREEAEEREEVDTRIHPVSAVDAHKHAKARRKYEGYNQTYMVLSLPPGVPASPHRSCYFRCGQFTYTGTLDLGVSTPVLADVPSLIPTLQSQQGKLVYFGTIGDAKMPGSLFSRELNALDDTREFLMDECSEAEAILQRKKKGNGREWVNDEDKCFFELRTQGMPNLESVELIAHKTYLSEVVMVTLYFEGCWYVSLRDGAGTQPLLDTDFPDVSARGKGFQLACYDHRAYTSLFLWQIKEPEEEPEEEEEEAAASPVKKKAASPKATSPKYGTADLGYNQTYVILRAIGSVAGMTSVREALFRFGNWCYAGHIDMGTPRLKAEDLPTVVPILQLQQGALAYQCTAKEIPRSSRFAKPLQRMTEAAEYIEYKIRNFATELEELLENSRRRVGPGVESPYAWIEDDAVKKYFLLKTDHDHQNSDVEFIASKTYIRGMKLIIMYFAGSYYCALTEASGSHPLLDTQFPDVSWQCRGYHLDSMDPEDKKHPHFRGISLWESSPLPKQSTPKAASGAGDDDAEKTAAAAKQKKKKEGKFADVEDEEDDGGEDQDFPSTDAGGDGEKATLQSVKKKVLNESKIAFADRSESPATSPAKSTSSVVVKKKEGKTKDKGDGGAGAGAGDEDEDEGLSPTSKAKKSSGWVGAMPTHLKKMDKKLGKKLGKSLKKLGDLGPAPWEKDGRPRLGHKPLGDILAAKKKKPSGK